MTPAKCVAKWCTEHDDGYDWPSGAWRTCGIEVAEYRAIRVTSDVMLILPLCAAHVELIDAVGDEDGTFRFVRLARIEE